jgi:hypothetical protein
MATQSEFYKGSPVRPPHLHEISGLATSDEAADPQKKPVEADMQTDALVYRALVTLESQQLVADDTFCKLGPECGARLK